MRNSERRSNGDMGKEDENERRLNERRKISGEE